MAIRILLVGLWLCLDIGVVLGVGERPVTFADLYSFANPQSLALSGDGKWLAYTVSRSNVEENSISTELWLMDRQGGENQLLQKSAGKPRWIGRQQLAFIADAGENRQLFQYDLGTKKTTRLTELAEGISDYVWAPDHSGLLVIRPVKAEKREPPAGQKHGGLTYDSLLFRHVSRWDDGRVDHVFYYQFALKQLLDLTPGAFAAPSPYLGSGHDWAFSPDARTVAYTSNTDPVNAISTNNDIFLIRRDGTNVRRLTSSQGCDNYPLFSADGRYLCYLQMARPGYEADQKDLILVDLQTDSRTNLTNELDLGVEDMIWSADNRHIYITCEEKGFNSLFRIDIRNGKNQCLLRERVFGNLVLSPDEQSFFCVTSALDRPPEIARYDFRGKTFTVLTHLTDDFVKSHSLARSEIFWFPGANGDPVMAFLTLPASFDPLKKYPLLMLFHGGPEGDWQGGWSNYGGNPQLFAAQGYVVVRPNIHGATSYGARFKEAILNNWGRVDQEDVLKCLDYLVVHYPYIDGQKIGASGRSYGGFLVNWLNGQTGRFACFVSVDGVFDQIMCYYSADELWFPEMEFGGTPMTNRPEYLRSSPSTYADRFKTPTLIIHGGRDYRVDSSQGIGMFTALQRQGIPSRLIYFPDEAHYIRQLKNWKYVYEQQFAWLARFLKN